MINERITPVTLLGGAVIIFGVWLVNKPQIHTDERG
jgi:drug/metabolite transporter (DMT)-like permease